eukprot:712898_1
MNPRYALLAFAFLASCVTAKPPPSIFQFRVKSTLQHQSGKFSRLFINIDKTRWFGSFNNNMARRKQLRENIVKDFDEKMNWSIEKGDIGYTRLLGNEDDTATISVFLDKARATLKSGL